MNRIVLICLLLIGSFTNKIVIASVTVAINQENYVFDFEPRLTDVLAPIASQQNWYWPSAVLFRVNDEKFERKRQSLLKNLSILSHRYQIENPQMAKSIEDLTATIKSWRLAKRLPISIDFDLARIFAAANPQLPQGKYILELAPRKNTIQLFGAVNKSSNVPQLPHADVSEYITDTIRSKLAEKDFVILIQADGRIIKAPVAYWNKAHQEVMPGSQIFMPFSESFFNPEFATINQQITTLALNRVQ